MQVIKSSSIVVCLFAVLWITAAARADDLRGFGRIQAQSMPAGHGEVFHCDSPEHATLLIHKLARDMALSATVTPVWTTISLGGRSIPTLVRPGLGVFLVLTKGSDAYCFTARLTTPDPDADAIASAFSFAAPFVSGAGLYDPSYTYPYYLDKWSDKGIGTWYTPYDPFDDDPKGLTDVVTPQFDYLKEHGLTAHVSGGLVARRETRHWIEDYKTPWHMQQWHEWDADLALLDPYDLTTPGSEFTATETYYGQLSYGGDKLQQYRDWSFEQTMAPYVNDYQNVDWDEPHGEIGPESFRFYYDYSEENRAHFVNWLQLERKYTLSSLGAAWYGNTKKFKSWSSVPIPFTFELLGCDPANSAPAESSWKVHTGDVAYGVTNGFQRPKFDDSQWVDLDRSNGDIASIFSDSHKRFWFRGKINVSPLYLSKHRGAMYLNDISLCGAGGPKNPDHIWFNGVDLGALSNGGGKWITGPKDVTGLIRPGVNFVAYSPADSSMPGTFYLSNKPVDHYPYADSGRNARYHDWFDYMTFGSMEEERHTLQAMRSVDPNRPIKIMAAGDKDVFNELMSDYGGFPHNTGDEAFFVPWDKRGGYPYGIPASAESSGSMPDPEVLKKWLGYFLFSGLNAFDNFIDVEAMMYTPAADVWKEYFPYLHLANRYDLKQPEIALLWSNTNDRLTDGLPYTYDLGRGDLQSIGYSYAYVSERAIHSGLAKPYKIIWDDGTWIMSKQTVADLRNYVEEGGTFVALQETGRSTFTEANSWPIDSLSGFKVKEVRPMSGFLTILDDQSLFKSLAGQNFENEGRSIDYSGYNYADKCVALEPVAGNTEAIARYRDGAIAIGVHRLGKGKVVVLGSPFWRDSYDNAGLWTPGQQQDAFLTDLLTGLGVSPDVPSDNDNVWKDRYVANNGSEEYLMLWNPSPTTPQTLNSDWTTQYPADTVFDPKTGLSYPAQISGNSIRISASLKPLESLILAVQSKRPPADAVGDWYAKTALWWKASLPGKAATRPDLPVFTQSFTAGDAKIVSSASVTPERLEQLSINSDSEGDWDTRLGSIRPFYAGITTTQDQSVIYRLITPVPATWNKRDRYYLRLNLYRSSAPESVYVNGILAASGRDIGSAGEQGIDISREIHLHGQNIVILLAKSDGCAIEPNITREPLPNDILPVVGSWKIRVNEDTDASESVSFPGTFNGLYATKSVSIPLSWTGSHVYIRLIDGPNGGLGLYGVNNRLIFHGSFTPRYMDITPWVKFGRPNSFLLLSTSASQRWNPGKVAINSIQLERVTIDRL